MISTTLKRRSFAAGIAAGALAGRSGAAHAAYAPALTGSPTVGFGTSLSTLYTGSHSHWLQPWREMMATRSFARIQDGIGLNCDSSYPQSLAMFAAAGFRHVRVQILWSLASYDDPATISLAGNAEIVTFVQAAQAAGLRPLVNVQAFDQSPCPFQLLIATATGAIGASDTTITLSSVERLSVGLSGLTGYFTSPTQTSLDYLSTTQVMCPGLITAIDGNEVTLSRPVGLAIPAGASLVLNTLLYKPWSEIGTADYDATMAGWTTYLGAISTFMQSVLGTAGASDLGFDLELWNETSFGSSFLDINNYYSSPIVPEQYVNGIPAVIPDIVAQSSAYVLANPTQFSGVRVTDGFASVSPMQAASTEPAAVTALSKHPYPSPVTYPAADPGSGGLDANGNATSFIPSYTIYTHEYFSTGISPFTLARDITTETNNFGGILHGQMARTVNGVAAPVSVWFTEFGTATANEGVTDPDDIAYLTAKGLLRALFFNLGIGVERLYAFTGVGDTTDLALVPSSAPTTPTMAVTALQSALSFIQGSVTGDQAGTLPAYSYITALFSGSPQTLFSGNGSTACPDFVQPADYVFIPIQVTPTRTAFVHWFTGVDMRITQTEGLGIALQITGLTSSATATVSAYSPIGNFMVPISVWGQTADAIGVYTYADDCPVIIVVDQT